MTEFDQTFAGRPIALRHDGPRDDGHTTGFVWLGGFMSDMTGTKAEAVADFAREVQRPCLRFDYSGHGQSGGTFTDGTISRWLAEARQMMLGHTRSPRILVGSSMGGWIAALLLRSLDARNAARIKGLVLIAPAHDFTEKLMWDRFGFDARDAIATDGVWMRPSAWGSGYPITRALIEDGRNHLLLDEPYACMCPVHILQGSDDADVPWQHALKIHEGISGPRVRFTLVKSGDHRLSSADDIRLLKSVLAEMAGPMP